MVGPYRRVVIFAGPNGSGKSTLTRRLQTAPDFDFPSNYINADDIAHRETEGSQKEKEYSAFRQARELRQVYRDQGASFAFETVFSHPSNLLDLIRLKESGYQVVLCFVSTANPRLNVLRITGRVQAGGHAVPEDKILARYERALQFLPRAVEIADQTYLYDNSNQLQLVATMEQGELLIRHLLPDYYRQWFLLPLQTRAISRQQFAENLQVGELLQAPNEEGGVYEGIIRKLLPYYALMETKNGERVVVWHDLSLFPRAPEERKVGRISYKEGYGNWEETVP